MPNVAASVTDLLDRLAGIVVLEGDRVVVVDEARLRGEGVRDLAWTAAFSEDPATVAAAQWIVWQASQALGARSASIHELYLARARGEVSGFTVP
ncbi:MAG TPA: aldolase, partial [Candidatus Eisenbacteria bacterium]|nr:aldolase [Candidatus Eisenbacteria bacterium]